MRCG
jgi:heme A synthase